MTLFVLRKGLIKLTNRISNYYQKYIYEKA